MERKKMIDEITKKVLCCYKDTCIGCESAKEENGVYKCQFYGIANKLYNAGYRKIPEGAVVLTKEEYERLRAISYIQGRSDANKQSAEMILKLDNAVKNELKEKYCVEVE